VRTIIKIESSSSDESGEFRFSDATDPNQLVLFEKAPNLPALQARVVAEFSGKDVSVAED
jgi:hypothetical protein